MAKNPGNPSTLWSCNPDIPKPPEELLQQWRSKGGKNSQKKLAMKRKQAEILRQIMAFDYPDTERRKALKEMGLDGNFADAINLRILERAATTGDVEAMKYIRDTIGEKPGEAVTIGITDKPVSSIDMSALSDEELEALAAAKETALLEEKE